MDRLHKGVQIGAHQCAGYLTLIHDKQVLWKQPHYLVPKCSSTLFISLPLWMAVDVCICCQLKVSKHLSGGFTHQLLCLSNSVIKFI